MKQAVLFLLTLGVFSNRSISQITVAEPTNNNLQPFGTYRLTITGFQVNRQSWDDALNRDGAGDEIFFTSHTFYEKDSGKVLTGVCGPYTSRVFGDLNTGNWAETGTTERIRAGSAGVAGGLATGNNFPSATPWINNRTPNRQTLPFICWEGELIKGIDSIGVVPTIWEWDGEPDFFAQMNNYLINETRGFIVGLGIWAITSVPYIGVMGEPLDNSLRPLHRVLQYHPWGLLPETSKRLKTWNRLGDPKDRPIGMKNEFEAKYKAPRIFLDFDRAEWLASQNIYGLGPGVFGLEYIDGCDLKGHYTLYFKFEKLAANQPLITPKEDRNAAPLKNILIQNRVYRLYSSNSGITQHVEAPDAGNGAQLQISQASDENKKQQFSFRYNSDNTFSILTNKGLALEVYGWSMDERASITQWDWHQGANQKWIIEPVFWGENYIGGRLSIYCRFRNAHTGLYLTVPGSPHANNGAKLVQEKWKPNNQGQLFVIQEKP